MAKRLDWDRVNSEKKIEVHGKEPGAISMLDGLPPSCSDFFIEFDPAGDRRVYLEFLKRIVEAVVLGKSIPSVPAAIHKSVDPLICHYGGVIEWAQRTRDYGHLHASFVGKIAASKNAHKDKLRRQLLHKVARMDVLEQPGVEKLQPDEEIADEIKAAGSIGAWAKSRPEYKGIRVNALNHTKRARRQMELVRQRKTHSPG